MPSTRNIRRSNRLSRCRTPPYYDRDDWDGLRLLYPDTSSPSPKSVSSPLIFACSPAELFSPPTPDSTLSSPISQLADCKPSIVLERRTSHSRKRKDGHIPRPPNAFMFYRSEFWAQRKTGCVERDHRQISRIVGHCWHQLTEDEKAPYRLRAAAAKAAHQVANPGYKYSPVSRKDKTPKRRVHRGSEDEEERCRMIANLLSQGVERHELEERMKNLDLGMEPTPASPKPSSGSRNRNRRRSAPRAPKSKAKAKVAPVNIKHESLPTPTITQDDASLHSDYVPTEQIPSLELSPPSPAHNAEANKIQFEPVIVPTEYSLDYINNSFSPSSAMLRPYKFTELTTTSDSVSSPSSSPLFYSPTGEISFIDPFAASSGGLYDDDFIMHTREDEPVSPHTIPQDTHVEFEDWLNLDNL